MQAAEHRAVIGLAARGLARQRHQPDRAEARRETLEPQRRRGPGIGAVGGLQALEAAPDAIEKRAAQLGDQRGLVAHRSRQRRIDCTGIIGHDPLL